VAPQGQNELWLALALSHPAAADLTGPQLAAYVGALVCAEVIRRPMSVWSPYQVPPPARPRNALARGGFRPPSPF
jgi:hypothetical protein